MARYAHCIGARIYALYLAAPTFCTGNARTHLRRFPPLLLPICISSAILIRPNHQSGAAVHCVFCFWRRPPNSWTCRRRNREIDRGASVRHGFGVVCLRRERLQDPVRVYRPWWGENRCDGLPGANFGGYGLRALLSGLNRVGQRRRDDSQRTRLGKQRVA
jgi:hypothetical protein